MAALNQATPRALLAGPESWPEVLSEVQRNPAARKLVLLWKLLLWKNLKLLAVVYGIYLWYLFLWYLFMVFVNGVKVNGIVNCCLWCLLIGIIVN